MNTRTAVTPAKIAFMHIPKTAGSTVTRHIHQEICTKGEHKYHVLPDLPENRIPGRPGRRPYTTEEMIEIARDPAPLQYVKNHTPWDREAFDAFKQNGWFVFAFVRHPGDKLCSLYHYDQLYDQNCHRSLDEYVRRAIETILPWDIPDFWEELDFIREFTLENLEVLLKERLGLPFYSAFMENRSFNLGYDAYCRSGEISPETQRFLEGHPLYALYQRIRTRDT